MGKVAMSTGAVARRLPTWDVDLGSVQEIGQLCLQIAPGEVLRDARLRVFDGSLTEAPVWSQRLAGDHADVCKVHVGARGRFVQVQAVALPIEGIDVLLPDPSEALRDCAPEDALTVTEDGWQAVGTAAAPTVPSHGQDGLTLTLSYAAGETYRVAFELAGSKEAGQLYAWWNGALVQPAGFAAADASRHYAFEVVATGALDQLTFRGTGAQVLPHNISVTQKPKPQAPRKWVTTAVPDIPAAANTPTGTIQGVLRRALPERTRGRTAARRATAFMRSGDGDEIIFR